MSLRSTLLALLLLPLVAPAAEYHATTHFQLSTKPGFVPAYKDNNNRALAINAAEHKNKFAAATISYPGSSGTYDFLITTLTETDGESTYRLLVAGRTIGEFQNPRTDEDYAPATHRWEKVQLRQGDEILIAFNTHSNGRTPEGDGFAFARGRWQTLAILEPGAEPLNVKPQEEPFPDPDTTSYFQFAFDPKSAPRIYEEKNGLLVVEAENFTHQTNDTIRKWYLTTKTQTPEGMRDPDGSHAAGASGGAYMEILPDTRKNHGEKLIQNENFTENPGRLAVLYYAVYINTPGRYYIWARTCPTGSEDNGLHVGLDGQWPGTGLRMQWISKNSDWHWDSKQRTEMVHTGVKYRSYLDVKESGLHTIMFSMREDGFEMDKWLISTNRDVLTHGDTTVGPAESPLYRPVK